MTEGDSHMSRYRPALVVTAALVLSTVVAPPAQAAEPDPYVPSAEVMRGDWGHVDAHRPRTGYLNPAGDAPVGDGKRSYFTFDVARFKGKHVISARLTARQLPADCVRHAVELWRTSEFTAKSTWNGKPKEPAKLANVECAENIAVDLTEAVAKGEDRITLGLRVPTRHEWDKRYARKYANDLKLQIVYNTPPPTPTNVWAGYSFDGEPERVVAGNSVTYTPSCGGDHTLTARSKDSSGDFGVRREYRFRVNTAPQIGFGGEALVGRPSTASFTPGMPGVVEYEYWWNDDEERKTVAAGPDGKAQVDWCRRCTCGTSCCTPARRPRVVSGRTRGRTATRGTTSPRRRPRW